MEFLIGLSITILIIMLTVLATEGIRDIYDIIKEIADGIHKN